MLQTYKQAKNAPFGLPSWVFQIQVFSQRDVHQIYPFLVPILYKNGIEGKRHYKNTINMQL